MLDIRWIRDNPDAFDRGLARRGLPPLAASILDQDRAWRAAQTSAEQLQAERNRLAKEIGAARAKGGDAGDLMRRVAESKAD
jgi:seryl-tRNA synthetase